MTVLMLVREDSDEYIQQNQMFKRLISTFFTEFLELFFPEIYDQIDLTSIIPLPSEPLSEWMEGENYAADIIVETNLKGQDTLIVIHVELQNDQQRPLSERMYHHFSILYSKYRKPILPIVILSYDDNQYEYNRFRIKFPFFHVLTFNFLMIELGNLNWRDFVQSNNPIAAALLSKMRYNERERVQVKKAFLRMLTRIEVNPDQINVIQSFFDIHLSLNKREQKELVHKVYQLDPGEGELSIKIPNYWIEIGKKEGRNETALEMLKKGLSIELISEVTHLDKNEIVALRRKT